jgi:hypothetical protein
VDGLFRSNATTRDDVRRRLLGVTTVAGLSACAAVGGLMVGLVPADAGQQPSTVATAPTGDDRAAQLSREASARARATQAAAARAAAQAAAQLKAARTAQGRAAAQAAARRAEAARADAAAAAQREAAAREAAQAAAASQQQPAPPVATSGGS